MDTKPSAELIIQYLEQNQHASALELSRALKLTVQDIRYNLRQLQSQEKIIAYSQRPAQGRGRPTTLYVLNTSVIQGLESLILTLFDLFASEHQQEDALPRIAATLSGLPSAAQPVNTAGLIALTNRLSRLNFKAHWEAHPNGPCIFLETCPYRSILDRLPQLCEIDRLMIAQASGYQTEIDQTQRTNPLQPCRFDLRQA